MRMGSNIGGFRMIFAMRIAEEFDVDPFPRHTLALMPTRHIQIWSFTYAKAKNVETAKAAPDVARATLGHGPRSKRRRN